MTLLPVRGKTLAWLVPALVVAAALVVFGARALRDVPAVAAFIA